MAQAARIVIDDGLEQRQAVADGDQLVDLFLVLADRETDLGVVEDEPHLGRGRVLIDRHRDAAERLRRGDRPIEAGPIIADDRELVAAAEAQRGETAGEGLDLARRRCPAPALPDAVILFAHGRPVAPPPRLLGEQLGKRIQYRIHRPRPFGRAMRSAAPSGIDASRAALYVADSERSSRGVR